MTHHEESQKLFRSRATESYKLALWQTNNTWSRDAEMSIRQRKEKLYSTHEKINQLNPEKPGVVAKGVAASSSC